MTQVKLIYLACPFRHPDPMVQKKRCAAARYTTAHLSLKGHHVFSPLTHNEPLIEVIHDAVPGEHWMLFDLAILAGCKKLYILTMEGWESSKGVAREIAFAMSNGLPIQHIAPPEEHEYLHLLLEKV